MTKEKMLEQLERMGVKKIYKPYYEPESGQICLTVRKPPVITDGQMKGSSIEVYNKSSFLVWTSHKSKAMRIARENGFKINIFDGEAEMFIPAIRADEFLKVMGAKVKSNRKASPQAIKALEQYHRNKRLAAQNP